MAPADMIQPRRILLLTSYFRPDLSAGSFRAVALVAALRAQHEVPLHIDVISTLPNRYRSFTADSAEIEKEEGLTIRRVRLPAHRGGMGSQVRSYIAFARAVNQIVAREAPYDLVVATSGRLMTAALSAWVVRGRRTPLYLDIRDIFVDTIADVLPTPLAAVLAPAFGMVERWTVNRANHVNLVSEGFRPYFETRYPRQSFSYRTNGIDDEFLAEPVAARPAHDGPVTILYAGNIGEGQGLHSIVPGLAARLDGRAKLHIIGDGGRRSQLERAIAAAGIQNVEITAPVTRADLLRAYEAADVLFLHLNDHSAFEKVLPSKIFEYAALGKPVLAGVAGYASRFIQEHVSNAAIFQPCDADAGARAFASLDLVTTPRHDFRAQFARATIMTEMAGHVLGFLPPR